MARSLVLALCLGFVAWVHSDASSAAPATQPAAVSIARFQGDRCGALSLTFDDGMRDQLDLAVPILRKLKLPATFFVIAGRTPETIEEAKAKKPGDWGSISWPELKAMSDEGFEISNHSWSHPGLTKILDHAELDREVNHSYDVILQHIGKPPLTFCYPGNGFNDRVRAVVLKRHLADRVSCFAFNDGKDDGTNLEVDRAIREKTSVVALIHGILNGYAPFKSIEDFESHLQYVKTHEDKIWVDTFANVSRYVRERDETQLTARAEPSRMTVDLRSSLDAQIYDVPLTIVIPVAGATDVLATSGGNSLTARALTDRILVDVRLSDHTFAVTWK